MTSKPQTTPKSPVESAASTGTGAPYQNPDSQSWLLQTTLDMKGSIGELSAKVDTLISKMESHDSKLDRIRILIAALGGGAVVLLAVLSFLVYQIPWRPLLAALANIR